MKIAIWYTWAGVGHYRAAKAIADGFKSQGYKVDLINPVEVLAASSSVLARSFAGFYNVSLILFRWSMANSKAANSIQEEPGFWGKIVEKVLLQSYKTAQKFVGSHSSKLFPLEKYQTLICTHPVATGIGLGVRRSKKLGKLEIINVFVDEAFGLTPKFYLHTGALLTVNSQKVKRYCEINMKINASEIALTGYVADPKLLAQRSRIYTRVQTSLKKGQITIGLFLGGFAPLSQQQSILDIIHELATPIKKQRVLVKILTGPHKIFNQQVKSSLKALEIEKLVEVKKTNNLKDVVRTGHKWLLEDINILFSRPSELVFYSLLTGIPHFLLPPLGGQERQMRKFLRGYAKVKDYLPIKSKLLSYLTNKSELMNMSKDLYKNNYPLNGVKKLVKLVKTKGR